MQPPADSSGNVVLYVAAMTSFVTLCGVIVNGFVQWSASRDARDAARDARGAAQESKATMDKVEVLVNNKSDRSELIIKELTEKVDRLQASALAKAEAAPAVGGVPIGAATPPISAPVPVKIVAEEPVPVKIDKTPNKGKP